MGESSFKNKRVLLVCRETYSKPLWFVAERLKKENEVAAFYIMSSESAYNKCYYNEHTIYEFREHQPDVKLYDVKDMCDTFVKGMQEFKRTGRAPMDMAYLNKIDEEYTHYKNLNMQLMSSQMNTRHYHWRMYWSVTS